MLALFSGFGTPEVVIILLVILLLFGARKIPEVMRSLGEGIREFKKASKDVMQELEEDTSKQVPPLKPPTASATTDVGQGSESEGH